MKRPLRTIFRVIGTLVVLFGAFVLIVYNALFAGPGEPAPGGYSFDIEEVRRLADSMPGDKPRAIAVETVGSFEWPELLTMAGGSLRTVWMGCFAFQLITPSGHYIIDTGMDREIAGAMPRTDFYEIAYDRMQAVIRTADLIAITHEHPDHIGGITKNPDVKSLHHALRLTHEQISDPDRHANPPFPAGALDGYEPLQYEGMTAIAPGVVLIAAAGHTHGSQMVYVQLADGREVLFLGDVAWMWKNVTNTTPRPKFVSDFALPGGEDRPLVYSQLKFLRELTQNEPNIVQIPGHDMNVIRRLMQPPSLLAPMFVAAGERVAETDAQADEPAIVEPAEEAEPAPVEE